MRALFRFSVVVTVTLAVVSGSIPPAAAKQRISATAFIDGANGSLTAEAADETVTERRSGGGGATDCHWERLPAGTISYDDLGNRLVSPTGRWLQKVCDGSPVMVGGSFAVPERPPVDPRTVARQARESVSIPEPTLLTAPPPDRRLYVQMRTWLWLDPSWWKPYTATADTGAVSASVVATPVRTIWTMGDGRQTTCDGPGVAWRRGLPEGATTCAYTYRRSSAGEPGGTYTMSVAVEFEVSWSSSAGSGGVLPAIIRTASRPVEVGEIQAVETR